MNREKEYRFLLKQNICLIYFIDIHIFDEVSYGFCLNWDENYWCMVEQVYCNGI